MEVLDHDTQHLGGRKRLGIGVADKGSDVRSHRQDDTS
jgi:hypothetical protein